MTIGLDQILRLADLDPWSRTHVLRDGDDAVGWLCKVASSDKVALTTTFVASTAASDRMGDVVSQDSWNLREFLNNPCILDNHQVMRVVGNATDAAVRNRQLEITVAWDTESPDPSIRNVGHQHLRGIRRAGSVGFRSAKKTARNKLPKTHPAYAEPVEMETWWGGTVEVVGTLFEDNTLLEFSSATIPANPEALQRWALGPTAPSAQRAGPVELVALVEAADPVSRSRLLELLLAGDLGTKAIDALYSALLARVRSDRSLIRVLMGQGFEPPPAEPAQPSFSSLLLAKLKGGDPT